MASAIKRSAGALPSTSLRCCIRANLSAATLPIGSRILRAIFVRLVVKSARLFDGPAQFFGENHMIDLAEFNVQCCPARRNCVGSVAGSRDVD